MITFSDKTAFGYSQFVEVDLGNCKMVVISGQVPMDGSGATVGAGDFVVQADTVYANLMKFLKKAGGQPANLIKLNVYVTDVAYLPELRKVRDKYVNTVNPPASTTVQVAALFRPEVLIEIEATAIIPH